MIRAYHRTLHGTQNLTVHCIEGAIRAFHANVHDALLERLPAILELVLIRIARVDGELIDGR